jgi:hypothetical protein
VSVITPGQTRSGRLSATMAQQLQALTRQQHELRLEQARERLQGARSRVRNAADALDLAQRHQAQAAAALRELEATSLPDVSPEQAADQIARIQQLPGIMEVSSTPTGDIVVTIRAAVLYQGRKWVLGEWRLSLSGLASANGSSLPLELVRNTCKTNRVWRSGCDCGCSSSRYVDRPSWPFYWSPFSDSTPTGRGSFCFGEWNTEIMARYRTGDYAAAVNLVIAGLCHINGWDWDYFDERYDNSQRLSPRHRRNWKLGYHPDEKPAGHPGR